MTVRHRFTAEYVESGLDRRARGRRRLLAEALFPSWGGAPRSVVAVRADGTGSSSRRRAR